MTALADTSLRAARRLTTVAAAADDSELHADAVAMLSARVADQLGLGPDQRREVALVGMLHDVGKAEVPPELIVKRGPLTAAEHEIMKQHTILGEQMLRRADPTLDRVAGIVRSCHERWDGGGYPDGLVADDIPLAARIVFCCDAYDAMTTDRPYRRALGHAKAVRELRDGAGTQFDPRVVGALLRVLAELGSDAPGEVRELVAATSR